MYSFKKPKPKPIFAYDTTLWLIFISISTLLYISFALFLYIKSYFFKKDIQNFTKQIISFDKQINKINFEKETIYFQKSVYEDIQVKNSLIKESIKNLLSLIPDPITLQAIKFEKNSLIIYGITPSKDIYNLLMLPPLQSIFTSTQTNFYQLPNGWWTFKSINQLKNKNEY